MNEMDIELIHMSGDTMPADALSRQPLPENYPGIKEARQAKTEMKLVRATAAADPGPAHPIDMSDKQWKFEQSKDTLCKEMIQYVSNQRLSLIPGVKNIIALYLSLIHI